MAIKVPVKDMNGQEVDTVELASVIFEAPIKVGLMHQAYVRQMANARQGTHKAKSRGEIRLTKKKWYRQKGTGRARHGSKNAPIFVGGGVAHGPRPRKYSKDMPKKMRRAALRSALSAKAADEAVIVVDKFEMDEPKTRIMKQSLGYLTDDAGSVLVLLADRDENVEKSIRNLADATYLRANYLNVRDLLKYDLLVVPMDALDVINDWLGEGESA